MAATKRLLTGRSSEFADDTIHQGGDAFGATMVIGTTDAHDIEFLVDDTPSWAMKQDGSFVALQTGVVIGDLSAPPSVIAQVVSVANPGDATESVLIATNGIFLGDGTNPPDWSMSRTGVGVVLIPTGSKLQQTDPPTLGPDLCNKTYVDAHDGIVIGAAVSGGIHNAILFVDNSGNALDGPTLTFNPAVPTVANPGIRLDGGPTPMFNIGLDYATAYSYLAAPSVETIYGIFNVWTNVNNSGSAFFEYQSPGTINDCMFVRIRRAHGPTLTTQDLDQMGGVMFEAWDAGTPSLPRVSGQIYQQQRGAAGVGFVPGSMTFYQTIADGTSPGVIGLWDGRLGVGTEAVQSCLTGSLDATIHVKTPNGVHPTMEFETIGIAQYCGTFIKSNGSEKWQYGKGMAGGNDDHFRLYDSIGGVTILEGDGAGNLQLGSGAHGVSFFGAGSFGSGEGVVFVSDATVNPSTNPTGGGILYADGGAGKWRGPSGTVSTFGTAEPHCAVCGSDYGHEWVNPRWGRLQFCMNCLSDWIASDHGGQLPGWIKKELVF